ncbi:MAG: hypothetical protein CMK92_06275 [Pseudomonas sp.]|nr:hypothetical protein [Pseudomonas sp.]
MLMLLTLLFWLPVMLSFLREHLTQTVLLVLMRPLKVLLLLVLSLVLNLSLKVSNLLRQVYLLQQVAWLVVILTLT